MIDETLFDAEEKMEKSVGSTREDINACLVYAARAVGHPVVQVV